MVGLMREIDKLRQRLSNVNRGVTEYKMTIAEAHALVNEFFSLEKKLQEKADVQPITKQIENIPIILNGGSF